MPLLFEDTVVVGTPSSEVDVVPNTLVSLNASHPVRVYAGNGGGEPVFVFSLESPTGGAPTFTATWLATSDTVQVQALHQDTYVTVYGEEE